jgi:hypothetical protein
VGGEDEGAVGGRLELVVGAIGELSMKGILRMKMASSGARNGMARCVRIPRAVVSPYRALRWCEQGGLTKPLEFRITGSCKRKCDGLHNALQTTAVKAAKGCENVFRVNIAAIEEKEGGCGWWRGWNRGGKATAVCFREYAYESTESK